MHVMALDAGVCHPRFRVIVETAAVVNAAQTLMPVLVLQDLKESVPIGHLLIASMIGHRTRRHQIEFVGQRPPKVAKCWSATGHSA